METAALTSRVSQKLQIKAGAKWALLNVPAAYLSLLEPLPLNVELFFEPAADLDGIQLFVIDSKQLCENMEVLHKVLKSHTILWVTYPKKSPGIKSDLQMKGEWDTMKQYGLEPVTAISVSDTWTALRFKQASFIKPSEVCNTALPKSEFADYIDVERKRITLPENIKNILEQTPAALSFFQSLSYSNRKEYVLWILTAKQEKTRQERLKLLTEKLLAGNRNPSER